MTTDLCRSSSILPRATAMFRRVTSSSGWQTGLASSHNNCEMSSPLLHYTRRRPTSY